ncbi:MAG: beta-lactamase family protein [Bryobacterales bacterium]|nr:beta-lactamase family protein [Bryobacterales bacterium]
MPEISRRQFGGALLILGAARRSVWGATTAGIDQTLRDSLQQHKIPAAAAMAATSNQITYSGAFGKRDSASDVNVTVDSIFAIASMTKPITSVAAMQLVEQGKLKLDEPASTYLPELGTLQVLHGFDPTSGKPILRPATKPVTLRRLLTHTSGFVYDTWDPDLLRWEKESGTSLPLGVVAPLTPLMFEPGTRWQYGTSADWSGRLVEKVSGLTLEQYFQKNILEPLGMHDTSFLVPASKFDRLVSDYRRQEDGSLKEDPRRLPPPPKDYNGGGGLYSTASDYVRFMQMILRKGSGPNGERILQARTVAMMTANQIGDLSAGKLKTVRPALSSDVDFHPGFKDGFGFGFLINSKGYEGRRSAGSLAWAGVYNTHFWIDPHKDVSGVLMMQFLPFVDKDAVAVLGDFERAVYAGS